jgi:hypothetical protein
MLHFSGPSASLNGASGLCLLPKAMEATGDLPIFRYIEVPTVVLTAVIPGTGQVSRSVIIGMQVQDDIDTLQSFFLLLP